MIKQIVLYFISFFDALHQKKIFNFLKKKGIKSFDIMFDVGGNKYNHHTAKNVRRLIPFQNVWYLDWLFDDIQKGLRFK